MRHSIRTSYKIVSIPSASDIVLLNFKKRVLVRSRKIVIMRNGRLLRGLLGLITGKKLSDPSIILGQPLTSNVMKRYRRGINND